MFEVIQIVHHYSVYGTISFTENRVHYTTQTRILAMNQKGKLKKSLKSDNQPQRDNHWSIFFISTLNATKLSIYLSL